MDDQIKTGTVEGTGAAINIECGFKPRAVFLQNVDGACKAEFVSDMAYDKNGNAITSPIYGQKTVDSGSGTTDIANFASAAAGIQHYNGAVDPATLTNTASLTAGSATITGSSTAFLSELREGDVVNIDGQVLTILQIDSNTSAIATTEAQVAKSGKAVLRLTGRTKGFTIGTDADLNASGETITYLAMR